MLGYSHISLFYNFTIETDRKGDANYPNIILKYIRQESCFLINMTILKEIIRIYKAYRNLSNNRYFETEIGKIGNLMTKAGSPRAAYLGQIPGRTQMAEIQEITLKNTDYIISNFICFIKHY